MDRVSDSGWRRTVITTRRSLCGEYAAMLLAMNAGFAGVVWALRSPDSPAAAGVATSCLWICLRSMHFPVRRPVALICSFSSVLYCGTVIAAGWIKAPGWLLRSPVSPFAVVLMASVILVADLAVRGSTIGNDPAGEFRGADHD